jgi:hypothetical protein
VVARTASDPVNLVSAIEHKVHAIDPDVPAYDATTMDVRLHESLARQRFAPKPHTGGKFQSTGIRHRVSEESPSYRCVLF